MNFGKKWETENDSRDLLQNSVCMCWEWGCANAHTCMLAARQDLRLNFTY